METPTRGALRRYVAVSYGITWLLWLPVALATYGVASFSNPYVPTWFNDLMHLRASTPAHWLTVGGGVLGPLVGAWVAWHHLAGQVGVRTLRAHLLDIRISDGRGWLGALLPVAYFTVGSIALLGITGVAYVPGLGPAEFGGLLIAGCILITGEELGWRGTLLPMLQETRSALGSSILVAIVWAFWHLPLILMWGAGPRVSAVTLSSAVVMYVLLTIPMSVMHTFAFNSARGLVLVSIGLHALHNHLNAVLDTPTAAPQSAVAAAAQIAGPVLLLVFWVFAVGLWIGFGRADLSPRTKVTATTMLRGRSRT